MFFLTSLSLLAVLIFNPKKTVHIIIFLTTAFALGMLGSLYFQQKMAVDTALVCVLAIGFLVIAWEPTKQLKSLERSALLHDIGKIGISDSILFKPGPLDENEWHAMRQHPDIGARMNEGIPFLQDAIPIIRYHQERRDGSGYPIGLKGEEIPLQARVFADEDVFDALTSPHPY
jgi:hypothetical protein